MQSPTWKKLQKDQPNGATTAKEGSHDNLKSGEANGAAGPKYPTGLKLAFIFVALCLAVFLVALVCIHILRAVSNDAERVRKY